MKDYYKILGLTRHATSSEIKKAFRILALKYHPDKNKDPNAEEMFIKIYEAYEILSQEHSKKIYDRIWEEQFGFKAQKAQESEYAQYKQEEQKATARARQEANTSFEEFKYRVLDKLVLAYDYTKLVVRGIIYISLGLWIIYLISNC